MPSQRVGIRLGLGGRRRSRVSGDGCDSHSHRRGLQEDLLFRSFADAARPKQYQEPAVDRLFFREALAETPLGRIQRNLPETPQVCEMGLYGSHSSCEDGCMLHKKAKKAGKKPDDALRASVRKEMARPRMAKSARITLRRAHCRAAKHHHAGNRRQNHPFTTPEAIVKGTDCGGRSRPPISKPPYRKLANGPARRRNEAQKGAHVEVPVAAKANTATAKSKKGS
jgi:hypothetical protein